MKRSSAVGVALVLIGVLVGVGLAQVTTVSQVKRRCGALEDQVSTLQQRVAQLKEQNETLEAQVEELLDEYASLVAAEAPLEFVKFGGEHIDGGSIRNVYDTDNYILLEQNRGTYYVCDTDGTDCRMMVSEIETSYLDEVTDESASLVVTGDEKCATFPSEVKYEVRSDSIRRTSMFLEVGVESEFGFRSGKGEGPARLFLCEVKPSQAGLTLVFNNDTSLMVGGGEYLPWTHVTYSEQRKEMLLTFDRVEPAEDMLSGPSDLAFSDEVENVAIGYDSSVHRTTLAIRLIDKPLLYSVRIGTRDGGGSVEMELLLQQR